MSQRAAYSGFIAKLHGGQGPKQLFCTGKDIADLEVLRERRWYSFDWTPRNPLRLRLERDGSSMLHTGTYPFILRESADRFILISTHHEIVQAYFKDRRVGSLLEYPRVDVAGLVNHLLQPGDDAGREYRISQVYAAVEGYGRSLRTMAFWGDDIANASLFRELKDKVLPFRVSLRNIRTDKDIAGIGSGGEVSLYFRGMNHLDQTDRLLSFLNNHGFMGWEKV